MRVRQPSKGFTHLPLLPAVGRMVLFVALRRIPVVMGHVMNLLQVAMMPAAAVVWRTGRATPTPIWPRRLKWSPLPHAPLASSAAVGLYKAPPRKVCVHMVVVNVRRGAIRYRLGLARRGAARRGVASWRGVAR